LRKRIINLELPYFLRKKRQALLNSWENKIVKYLKENESIKSQEAAKLWKISDRAARTILKKMTANGIIVRISTSDKDPHSFFVLTEKYLERNSN